MKDLFQKKFIAKVVSVNKLVPNVIKISFETEKTFNFLPGQYVWIELPHLHFSDPKGNRRAFSICSLPDGNNFSIISKISQSGYKQSLFSLNPNDEVFVHGPFGSLRFPENIESTIVCVAGGVGIAPFLSLIPDSLNKYPDRKITLIFANHSKEEAISLDYFEELQRKYPQFSLIEVVSKITPEILNQSKLKQFTPKWMIIGSKEMVYFTASTLSSLGVNDWEMTFEEFFWSKYFSKNLNLTKNADEILKAFKLAMEQTSNHVIMTDTDGYIFFANKAAETITGYPFAEMRGNTPRLWGGLMPPEFYKNMWYKIKIEKKPFISEIKNRRKNGETYDTIAHISPIKDNEGNLIGFMGTEEDISEAKNTNKELEESKKAILNILEDLAESKTAVETEKAKVDAMLESIGDGLIAVDNDRKVVMINTVAANMLGWERQTLIGKIITELPLEDEDGNPIPLEKRPTTIALLTNQISRVSYYFIKKDKTRFPMSITATPIKIGDKTLGLIEVIRDTTRETEIDRAKTEFISLASHQLRTPLTAIKWFCEIMISNDEDRSLSTKQLDNIKNISESNQRMIDLVNSLLNISRIESGRIIVDPKPTNIEELIRNIVKEVLPIITEKNQKITIQVQKDLPLVQLDPALIREVYINILRNALKYSPAGGMVSISITQKDNNLISEIKDTGYGILQRDKERVFTRFFRGENIIKLEPDGTGLGLYLVKSIIDSSGGKIWFDSVEGKGSTFWFTIPISGMIKNIGSVQLTPD